MATVGRNLAVVDIPRPRLHFGGLFAWLIWMSLHLMLILGVKNRLFVFMNWMYNYFTYDQNLRLIFKVDWESSQPNRLLFRGDPVADHDHFTIGQFLAFQFYHMSYNGISRDAFGIFIISVSPGSTFCKI